MAQKLEIFALCAETFEGAIKLLITFFSTRAFWNTLSCAVSPLLALRYAFYAILKLKCLSSEEILNNRLILVLFKLSFKCALIYYRLAEMEGILISNLQQAFWPWNVKIQTFSVTRNFHLFGGLTLHLLLWILCTKKNFIVPKFFRSAQKRCRQTVIQKLSSLGRMHYH